ncbi:MAG: FecR domain-containing protein [Verrucomicrobia subdivision 3 bacterium]|nr:FecR domain-containing protein [Limisphaerales bacterium]
MSEKIEPWREELDTLLNRLVDGELTEAETARLNDILRDEPAAADEYHAFMDLHEALNAQLAMPDFTAMDKVIVPQPQPSYVRPLLAMAALVMIGFFINALVQEPNQPAPPLVAQAKGPEPIATIKGLSGSLMYTGDRGIVRNNLKEGDPLGGGTIEGMTPDAWFELKFKDGSTVVISGNSMLTFSDDGQKKLRLKEGGFSANVRPQPKDKPMLVQTRTATFEVLGTRFSVDAGPTAATLTVSEGSVRATRLSDSKSVDVPAKHQVVAALDRELEPEQLPDNVSQWASDLERGAKGTQGDWTPARAGQPTHLKAVPYTIPAALDEQQRTIYTIAMAVSRTDHPPVILQPGSSIRIRGQMDTPHAIWFGVTLRRANGDFGGHFEMIVPEEKFEAGQPFDVTLNPADYKLSPTLQKLAKYFPKNAFDLKVEAIWCHSLWDSVGLQVHKMGIIPAK